MFIPFMPNAFISNGGVMPNNKKGAPTRGRLQSIYL